VSVAVPSEAVTAAVKLPIALGVPDTTPVDPFIERPVGRPVALNVSVWPSASVAVIATEAATP
jgi:hypothetical protein